MAASIYSGEVPNCPYREDKLPPEPFTFDITSLTDLTSGRVAAQVAYSEGIWTKAPRLSSPYISKLPSLKIKVRTTNLGLKTTADFADLEIIGHDPSNGKKLRASNLSFRVIEKGLSANVITDPTNPLFVDVIRIIDLGIGIIYPEKIIPLHNRNT
jgi:hypothetical protein